MSLTIDCMREASGREGIPASVVDNNSSVLVLSGQAGKRVVINTHVGLLTDAEWQLFRDKFYTYSLYGGKAFFPETVAYIDPHAKKHFKTFVTYSSVEAIALDIEAHFQYPVIVKRNSGTQGQNVYYCQTLSAVKKALERIYSKKQLAYDHVALAQAYVKPVTEYRLAVFESKLEFAYIKPHRLKKFGGKSQPWLVTDVETLKRLGTLVTQLSRFYPLLYAGIDVVEKEDGSLQVIEINGSPTYSRFIKTNGSDRVVEFFRKVVRRLLRQ